MIGTTFAPSGFSCQRIPDQFPFAKSVSIVGQAQPSLGKKKNVCQSQELQKYGILKEEASVSDVHMSLDNQLTAVLSSDVASSIIIPKQMSLRKGRLFIWNVEVAFGSFSL